MVTPTGQAQDHFAKISGHDIFSGISDRWGSCFKVWNDGYEQKVQPIIGFDKNGNPVKGPFCSTRDFRGAHSEEKKYSGGDPGDGMNLILHSTGADPRKALIGAGAEHQKFHAPPHRHPRKHTYAFSTKRREWYADGGANWLANGGSSGNSGGTSRSSNVAGRLRSAERVNGSSGSAGDTGNTGSPTYDNGMAVALTRMGNRIKNELEKIVGPWNGPSPTGGNPFGGWLNKMMSQVLHKIPFADKATEMMSMMSGKGLSHMTDNNFVQSAMKTIMRTAGIGVQGQSGTQSGLFGAGSGNGSIIDKAIKSHSFNTPTASFAGDVNAKSEMVAEKFQQGSFSGAIGGAFGHVKLAPARHGLATVRKLAGHTHEYKHPLKGNYHFGINMGVLKTVAPELVGSPEAIFGDTVVSPTTQEGWTALAQQWQIDHINSGGVPPDIDRIVADLMADGPHTDTTAVFETQTIDTLDIGGTVIMSLNAINDQQDQIDAAAAQQAIDEAKQAADEATIAIQTTQINGLQQRLDQLYNWISAGNMPTFLIGNGNLNVKMRNALGMFATASGGSGVSVDNSNVIQGRYGFFYVHSFLKPPVARMRQKADSRANFRAALLADTLVSHGMFWNRADEARVNIDIGGLTATSASALPGGTRCLVGVPDGKVYWEVFANEMSSNATWGAGMANQSYSLSDPLGLGSSVNSFGYYRSGILWFNGIATHLQSFNIGATLSFAVDMDDKLLWVRVNGGSWNNNLAADPASNIGGISLAGITPDAYYPALWFNETNLQAVGKFKRSSWTFIPPAGFVSLVG